jgi:phenylacetate-CoA ligase
MIFNDIFMFYKILSLKSHINKSSEEILEIRERKFRKILKHAYRKSPFYRELYSGNGIEYKDLDSIPIEKLPSIDKDDMINNIGKIITAKDIKVDEAIAFAYENKDPRVFYKDKYQVIHSAGSSGRSAVFLYSNKEMTEAFSANTRLSDSQTAMKIKKVAFYAGVDGRFGGVSLALQGGRVFTKRFVNVQPFDINAPLEKTLDEINSFQPDMLSGYTTGISILAKCQQEGRIKVNPKLVMCGGEPLSEADHNLIKSVYKVPVVNNYGASEAFVLGVGGDEYDGMYLMDDIHYIEIMEDHALVTNLYNFTQPIIRYRLDDRLTLKEDKKKILPFRLIDNIIGRDEAPLWFKNEKGEKDYIHPVIFSSFCLRGIDKYQILLKSEESFELLVIIANGTSEAVALNEAKTGFDQLLAKKGMKNVTYSIKPVEHPLIDKKSKKFKFVLKDY